MGEVKQLRQPKRFKTNVSILTKATAHHGARITIVDGGCVAVLVRGEKPVIHELDGQGVYNIDCPENEHDLWPIAIVAIDKAHKVAWANLKSEEVMRILDRCQRAAERRLAGQPISNGDPAPSPERE
ncbi:hypothetical protein [Aestuariivirga sp.]|uniref:hypothetical protein n=1 Tax=Aestuariivirga sp. TaxID=2650926 RepID=UPI0039E2C232